MKLPGCKPVRLQPRLEAWVNRPSRIPGLQGRRLAPKPLGRRASMPRRPHPPAPCRRPAFRRPRSDPARPKIILIKGQRLFVAEFPGQQFRRRPA